MDSQWRIGHAHFNDVINDSFNNNCTGLFFCFVFLIYSPYRGGQRRDNVCVVEVRVGHQTHVLTGLAWWW